MANHIEPPFVVMLEPSRRLRQLFIAVHWLATAAAIANGLPSVIKVILVIAVAVHYVIYTIMGLSSPIYSLKYSDDSGWEIGEGSLLEPVDILKSTVLTTFAVWLHFKTKSGTAGLSAKNKRAVLIMSDALDEDDYRRLIVKLKTAA